MRQLTVSMEIFGNKTSRFHFTNAEKWRQRTDHFSTTECSNRPRVRQIGKKLEQLGTKSNCETSSQTAVRR